jgi:hypothetical protein
MRGHSMDQFTLDNVRELLGTSNIPGSPEELEVLVKWTHRLAKQKGTNYVRRYRRRLYKDWKHVLEVGLSHF